MLTGGEPIFVRLHPRCCRRGMSGPAVSAECEPTQR